MLRTTKNMKDKYEKIQSCLFELIPEKWDEIYLYASVIDRAGDVQTGEMYFYYLPKKLVIFWQNLKKSKYYQYLYF